MLTDIRINPDNLLSGYIRISEYLFNYPSIWLTLYVVVLYFYSGQGHAVFQNFYASFKHSVNRMPNRRR